MFRGGQPNSYDEIVAKTTDENLTGENWELILNLCDKVQDEGEPGARNVIAAVLKRLTHRNPNVQLYTLTLAESLTKNCGIEVHREISSRAFTQGLERLITDRTTHEKVKRRALSLMAWWSAEFEKDSTLGIMEECCESLKSKGYKFEAPDEPPPPDVDDEVRRREEEELQRALEMSVQDKGGRGQWNAYSLASSSGAGSSGASSSQAAPVTTTSAPQKQQSYTQRSYGGYVPSANPAVSTESLTSPSVTVAPVVTTSSPAPSVSAQESIPIVTRVRALHTFEPTEAGELAFEKGDIIKVVDRGYKDWWRGQLKGRTGIFPVNYVEPLPEPTAAELAKEAEQEAAVFSQAANVDRLLTLLRGMDPAKDNLADNEEIQELYRNCMSLRPKIVKLIDKYSQKRADLVSMNETFVKARTIFDRMMEESLARHTAMYDGRPAYPQAQSLSYIGRPDSRGRQGYGMASGPQQYGWNPAVYEQPGYNAYPAAAAAYSQSPEGSYPGTARPQSTAYTHKPQRMYAQPQAYGAPAPYSGQPEPQAYAPQALQPQAPSQATLQTTQTHYQQPQPQQQPQLQSQSQPQPQPQQQLQAQAQLQAQPQSQAHVQAQSQAQAQPQPQAQEPNEQSGPPYVFDPNMTYPDPNAQAWAQYYAQGGTDPTGSVYFISVPGVKEGPPPQVAPTVSQDIVQQSQAQAHGQAGPAQYSQQGTVSSQGTPSPYQHATYESPAPQQSSPEEGDYAVPLGQPGQDALPASGPTSQPNHYYSAELPAVQQHGAPAPTNPTASVQPQQPAYGATGYTSPAPQESSPPPVGAEHVAGAQQPGWQTQYYGLPGQLASMDVSGEGAQGAHPGPQGVGAPA